MEMAKVTSKGQITIPISIRRRLGINEGDKILFINKHEGVLMLNPDTVQGDIADYTADDIPLGAEVASASAPAPAAAVPPPTKAAAKAAPPRAPAEKPLAAAPSAPAATAPIEPPRRKYIPPIDDEPVEKPLQTGGINLSTLLDDFRSIGDLK